MRVHRYKKIYNDIKYNIYIKKQQKVITDQLLRSNIDYNNFFK